jgi:hypothetical protein
VSESAREKARGKCCYCGADVSVAENTATKRDMVMHATPACAKFLDPNDDPDAYARRCNLQPIDPIAEEMKKLLT